MCLPSICFATKLCFGPKLVPSNFRTVVTRLIIRLAGYQAMVRFISPPGISNVLYAGDRMLEMEMLITDILPLLDVGKLASLAALARS